MAQISLGGMTLFGTIALRQQGPKSKSRNLRRRLPGVPGYRIVRLTAGKIDGRTFTIRGRLIDFTLGGIERQVDKAGQIAASGNLYSFRSTGGIEYKNCELTDFNTVGPYQRVELPLPLVGASKSTQFWVVEVQGVVEQAGPT